MQHSSLAGSYFKGTEVAFLVMMTRGGTKRKRFVSSPLLLPLVEMVDDADKKK